MKNKTVMPKQAAPVERLSPATAGAAEKGGMMPQVKLPSGEYLGGGKLFGGSPFAGDDAE
ncbi:anacyclamide/piricyclamide family prenylated cyclic peptide [Kamptonema formosum]|uniref:anacyclamide/piricyclamide family prenylated cyclic peptide n=1 Tax=Kamptonema formosum TaxID=331992 RepID=UPI000347DA0B|nr:anacyclamide/piricyclamide family prenylated cyclic peptide [Oscillatoria sp. PCC 10802]